MDQVTFTDGATFTIETTDGLVQLVVRSQAGDVLHGYEFTPVEAHYISEALNAAAFRAQDEKKIVSRPVLP